MPDSIAELIVNNSFEVYKSKYESFGETRLLLDKQVIVIANLMPREMKFGVSDGMVLATSDKEEIVLISPLKNVTPGSKIS